MLVSMIDSFCHNDYTVKGLLALVKAFRIKCMESVYSGAAQLFKHQFTELCLSKYLIAIKYSIRL